MKLKILLIYLLMVVMISPVNANTPYDAVEKSLATINPSDELTKYYRFLWIHTSDFTTTNKQLIKSIFQGHINQVSSTTYLSPVESINDNIIKINLLNYNISPKVWDKLFDSDYTFYTTINLEQDEVQEYGYYKDGKWIKTRDVPTGKKIKKTIRASAPWVNNKSITTLQLATESKAPIVHAFNFFANSATSGDGRSPNYYELLRIRDEKSFQELLGVDLKRDKKFSVELLSATGISGITQGPRAIERTEKIGGGYWRSYDIINKVTNDETKDPLISFGTIIKDGIPTVTLEYDATEQYGHLPNGLWATALFNNKGEIQDTAPPNIAQDSQPIAHNNHQIYNNVSCIRCHINGGMQDINDWVRNLPKQNLSILYGGKKYDYNDLIRLRQQYERKLEPSLALDRKRYSDALLEITGLTPEKYAEGYIKVWDYSNNVFVDSKYMEADTGVSYNIIQNMLQDRLKSKYVLPVLGPFVKNSPNNKMLLTKWKETYATMMIYLTEYKANN